SAKGTPAICLWPSPATANTWPWAGGLGSDDTPGARRVTVFQTLLQKLDDGPPPRDLRMLRAVEALEANGTAGVPATLALLARGATSAPLTREARNALTRLGRQ